MDLAIKQSLLPVVYIVFKVSIDLFFELLFYLFFKYQYI